MLTLFDTVRQAQGGAALDNLARQFGLSVDQTRKAVDAILPAFTLGFQRSAANPPAFAHILEMISSGRYGPIFDAFMPGASRGEGHLILDRLFGSREITRQVAGQTAAVAGIAPDTAEDVMASVAALVMGGLFRSATIEGLADFLRAWSDWLRSLRPGEPAAFPMLGPFAAWFPQPVQPPPQRTGGMFDGPWAAFFPSAPPKPATPPPAEIPNPFAAFVAMLETGRDIQQSHLAALQEILGAGRERSTDAPGPPGRVSIPKTDR